MLTPQLITDLLLRGDCAYSKMVKIAINAEITGCQPDCEWKDIVPLGNTIQALKFKNRIQDYYSDSTQSIYNKLLGQIGMQCLGMITLDPSAQQPGGVQIITIPVSYGYNSGKIPFTSTEDNPAVQLLNYHTLYYPLYGNNPTLGLYDNQGNFIGDQQTSPEITYESDQNSNIVSILWDLPPLLGITTTGYVQISGQSPFGTSGSGSGNGIQPPLSFTQANLLVDNSDPDNPLYYLPLSIGINQNVAVVTSNGVTVAGWVYNPTDYTPGRIYGFANNDTQTIKVQII